MADNLKFLEREILNKVLNAGEDALNVDLTAGGSAMLVDDAAFTPGTSTVQMIGAEFDDTGPDSVDEGDAGAVRMSANRNIYTTIRDAAGNERGVNVDGSNQLQVVEASASAIATDAAAIEVLLTAANVDHAANEVLLGTIDADTNAIKGHVDGIETLITSTNSKIDTFDAVLDNILTKNTEIDAVLDTIDADTSILAAAVSTEMQVDVVGSLPAGSAAIGKLAANSGVDIGDVDVTSLPASTNTLEVVGDAAENAAAAGNPVLTGGRYDSPGNDNATVRALGDNDVGALALDPTGALYVREYLGQTGSCFVSGTSAVTAAIGKFVAIQFLEDTVFNSTNGLVATDTGRWPDDSGAASDISSSNTAAVGSQVFPQGMTIFGRWDSFILVSGAVIAYVGNV